MFVGASLVGGPMMFCIASVGLRPNIKKKGENLVVVLIYVFIAKLIDGSMSVHWLSPVSMTMDLIIFANSP